MTPETIRFAADGMLQALATWLRVIGYDCLAGRELFGRKLLELAVAEERVFLTRNTHLQNDWPHELLARAQVFYVADEYFPDQLREIVSRFALEWQPYVFSRCVVCNRPLERSEKSEALAHVPLAVGAREEIFWHCAGCGRYYWHGTHVLNSLKRLKQWLSPQNPR